jgi:hypothetical protein
VHRVTTASEAFLLPRGNIVRLVDILRIGHNDKMLYDIRHNDKMLYDNMLSTCKLWCQPNGNDGAACETAVLYYKIC